MRVFLLVLISASLLMGETYKFGLGEWEPFVSSKDKSKAICEEIVQEALKLEGVDAVNEYYPWKRSYEMTKDAKLDATYPWGLTDERKELFIYSDPMLREKSVFFHLKSTNFDWNSYEDLKKYKVGVTNGYKDEEIYKKHGIKAEVVPKEDLNFKKMLAGRIDVYAGSFFVGYGMINKLFPDKANLFTNHKKPQRVDDYYMLVSKKNPKAKEIISKFNAGLTKLKESGRYDQILAKYSGL